MANLNLTTETNDVYINTNKVFTEGMQNIQSQEAATNDAMRKLLETNNLSKEEYERLWQDAYEKACILIDYKVRMGGMLFSIKPAKGNHKDNAPARSIITRKQVYEALGLTRKQSDNYQELAKNPIAVEIAKKNALKEKEIPTVYCVLKVISSVKIKGAPPDRRLNCTDFKGGDIAEFVKRLESKKERDYFICIKVKYKELSDRIKKLSEDNSVLSVGK